MVYIYYKHNIFWSDLLDWDRETCFANCIMVLLFPVITILKENLEENLFAAV